MQPILKNRFTQPADFWQERDFGAKISAAFDFIGSQWRPLGKALLYFVLPPAILLGLGASILTNRVSAYYVASEAGRSNPDSLFSAVSMGGLAMTFIGLLLAAVMLSATVYGYLRARLRLPPDEEVQPRHVWQAVRARLGWVVLGVFVLGAIGFVAFFFVSVILGLMARALGVWGGMLGSLLQFGVLIYINVAISLYFPVLWLEDQGIFSAVGRSFQLIKGYWWSTAGLVFVSGLIQNAISVLFIIPMYAVFFGRALHLPFLDSDVFTTIALSISAIGLITTYLLPMLILSFQYFNLVEKHEAFGSMLLLDELGQAPTAQSALAPDYFRPDDEGEY